MLPALAATVFNSSPAATSSTSPGFGAVLRALARLVIGRLPLHLGRTIQRRPRSGQLHFQLKLASRGDGHHPVELAHLLQVLALVLLHDLQIAGQVEGPLDLRLLVGK